MGVGYIGPMSSKSSGTSGADGKSSYEIAVENGFIGTEKEWLESLKGCERKSYKIEFDVDLNTGALYQHIYEKCDTEFKYSK